MLIAHPALFTRHHDTYPGNTHSFLRKGAFIVSTMMIKCGLLLKMTNINRYFSTAISFGIIIANFLRPRYH
jgi:hypothetical protein